MSIFVEVTSDRLEVIFSDLPSLAYQTSVTGLICDAASEPYRRGTARRWFAAKARPELIFMNGRPC